MRQTNDLEKSPEFQAWQAAADKLDQVNEQIARLRKEESELGERLRSMAVDDPKNLNDRATAFLDDGMEAINRRERLAEELQALRDRIEIVERATELQRHAVDKARTEYSAIVCQKKFRPAYAQAARRVLAAIEQLAEAFRAENVVTDAIVAADVARINIPTIRSPALNIFRDGEWVSRFIESIRKDFPEIKEKD
jgi:hypothetical protein